VFALMAVLHGSVLIAAPLECWLRASPPPRWLTVSALVLLSGATALRIWTLRTLGSAWSVRVTRYPDGDRPVVTSGPYRLIRHPNYVAVIIELFALPLVGGAWITALAASTLNAFVLARRIRLEERELGRSDAWRRAMMPKPRFVPRWS
jgi:methyltransferase